MNTILAENLVSFKELEQKIFAFVCELGREITQIMLESYDKELAEGRDKKIYRDKGTRNTSIKTVYGEVSYSRRVYRTKNEEGQVEYIYLLDQAMQMDKIGLISTNLAEKIALTITESPYRVTADIINETCGQYISPQGVWNLVQRLGERIDEEETHAVYCKIKIPKVAKQNWRILHLQIGEYCKIFYIALRNGVAPEW